MLRRVGEETAWRLLRALSAQAAAGTPVCSGATVALDDRGELLAADADGRGLLVARTDLAHGFEALVALDDDARQLLELLVPLCIGERSQHLVVAHLGQSLDGRLATVTGASRFVTGPEDVRHTHRLRALFDAVVVGAQTACVDDPQLTTRLVPGNQPARVVIDPRGRLESHLRVLRDGLAPTYVVTARGARPSSAGWGSHVEHLQVESERGLLQPRALLDALGALGLSRVFVEGGGVTVSRFLEAGVLDRLQIAVAPKIIGSGTPALQLAPIERISDAISVPARCFTLGSDVMFDCDLRREGYAPPSTPS